MKAFSKKSSYVLIILMITALLLTGTVPSFAAEPQDTYTTSEGTVYPLEQKTVLDGIPEVKGSSAILIDAGSGQILYEKNAEERRDPASITKIMTCLLTLEHLELKDKVTVTQDPVQTGQNIALKKGETLTVEQLLYAMMLHSANDAAEVLAVAVGGDIDTFAGMMNERAKECGAENTTFHNPNGLNPDGQEHNRTTAYDISLMAREAMKNPVFRRLVTTTRYKIPATDQSKERKLKSTNPCLGVYEGITGVKTGTSSTAGFCFCGSAKQGATELIAVSLNSGEDQRFTDVTKLLDYGFANYHTYIAQKGNTSLGNLRVKRGSLRSVEVGLSQDLALTLDRSDSGKEITTQVRMSKEALTAPVKKGLTVGTVTAYDKNHKRLAEAKLITLESAEKGGPLSYIGIADEDRTVFLAGLALAVILVILILVILKRMRKKKRVRRKAQRTRNIRRKAWEREKDPFNHNV